MLFYICVCVCVCAFDSDCLRAFGQSNLILPSRMRNGILLDYILHTHAHTHTQSVSLGPRFRALALHLTHTAAHNVLFAQGFENTATHPPATHQLGPSSCHLLPWLANANLGICNFLCLFIYASACICVFEVLIVGSKCNAETRLNSVFT